MVVRYTSDQGYLCKEFREVDGMIEKIAHGNLYSGMVEPVAGQDAQQLADLIRALAPNQCLGLGSLAADGPRKLALKGHEIYGSVSRSKNWISHRREITPLLIDVDAGGRPQGVSDLIAALGGERAAVEHTVRGLLSAGRLYSPSSSAHVEGLTSSGLHIYVWILDGTQSRDILVNLHLRAWLDGLGWIKIGRDGSLLVRSVIDPAVAGGERLVFEATPIIHPPLVRRSVDLEVLPGGLFEPVWLSEDERKKAFQLIKDAKAGLKEKAGKVRDKWVAAEASRRGVSEREFRRAFLDQRLLPDTLEMADARQLGELLAECEASGQSISIQDPFFPDEGTGKAVILPRNERYAEPCLWSFLHGGRKYRFERYALENTPPKFPDRGRPKTEGEAELKAAFESVSSHRRAITGSQGIGKTTLILKSLAGYHGVTACYVRSHENALELKDKLPADVRAMVVHGRVQEGMCLNIERVRRAQEVEMVIRRDICPTCLFNSGCAYLEQERQIRSASRDGEPLVLLLPHAYLHLPIPGEPKIHWAVIDEPPSDLFAEREDYSQPLPETESVFLWWNQDDDAYSSYLEWTSSNGPAGGWERPCRFDEGAWQLVETILSAPNFDTELPPNILDWPWRRKYRVLLEVLRDRERHPHRIWREPNGDVRVSRLKKVFLPDGVPLTILDGTGDIEIFRRVFGEDLEHRRVVVERDAEVTLVTGRSFSNSSFERGGGDDDAPGDGVGGRLVDKVACFVNQFGSPFVAAARKVLGALELTQPQKHFGALRGLNAYEQCQTAVIIGRMLPGPGEVEAIARAFAGKDFRSILRESDWYFRRHEGHRMADGSSHREEVEYHPDPWAQRILEQICDAEIAQAIDRVRPIYNHRKIFLLGRRVVDITVDRVVRLEELAPCRAELVERETGIILLSDSERARCHPETWPNRDAAREDHLSKEWVEEQPELIGFDYRVSGGQRSRWHEACGRGRLPLPNDLAGVVGELKGYKIDDSDPTSVLHALQAGGADEITFVVGRPSA